MADQEQTLYYAQQDGFIDGTYRELNEEVRMYPVQATYHLTDGRLGTEPVPTKKKEKASASAADGDKAGNQPTNG